MNCPDFDAGRCHSCTLMGQPYDEQLAEKQRVCAAQLERWPGIEWLPPVASAEAGFRNKAKMVVTGTIQAPVLGILDDHGAGVDLRACGLYAHGVQASFAALASFITCARLQPYDIEGRTGELKYLIVTESPDHELMVRFVLRSQEAIARIKKYLPTLLDALPQLVVASANIQPEPKAVIEGDLEIPLTKRQSLTMTVNDLPLHLRPQGFFQTNTEIAAALYRQGREWVDALAPTSVWDLYCGVGGFALHVASPNRTVLGIESSHDAVRSAELTATTLGRSAEARFIAADATAFALGAEQTPDLVIVNPPRRGLGRTLAGWLEHTNVQHVVYSSCNAESLAHDLEAMPTLRPTRARVLDMFPQSDHFEVITVLERG